MGKQTVDWNNIETWQHLVAAIVAAGGKPNLTMVAKYYGTTYNTLENRFRKISQDAKLLKEDVDGGNGVEAVSVRSTPTKKTPTKIASKTPTKGPLQTVTNSRIQRKTPTKKKPVIKPEQTDTDASFEFDDFSDGKMDSSFGNGGVPSSFTQSAATRFSEDMFTAGMAGMSDSDDFLV